jgi:hypothetical protein
MKKKEYNSPVCTVITIQPLMMIASSPPTIPIDPDEDTDEALSRLLGIEDIDNWGFY